MKPAPSLKFYFLLVIAMVSWGFSWPIGKMIAGTAPPTVIIFWRFLLTALSLIPIVILTKSSLKLPGRRQYFEVFIGGILYTIYNQFFLLGLENGLAGAGGVLVTTLNPILTYLLVHIWTRSFMKRSEVFGMVLGIAGGIILMNIWNTDLDTLFQSGNLFFLMASFSWAFVSMNSHATGAHISPIVYGFYVYTIGTILDFFLAFPNGLLSVFELDYMFWLYLGYLAIVSTTFGTTIYFFASTRLGSRLASSFIFLVPVTALLGAFLLLGEIPHARTLIGGGFAILAVIILNHSKT